MSEIEMNTKNNWPASMFQVFSLFMLGGITAIYITYLGEPNPLETVANLLTAGFALLATWLAIAAWVQQGKDDPGRGQWAALSIGIGLWTMAELLWAFLSYMMEETPYPSIADAFWVPGYIMVLVSVTLRYRALKIQWNSRTAQALLGIFAAILIVVLMLVILPIIASEDSDGLLLLLLNVFYPVADLLVLFAALLLALSFAGGQFSSPWAMLAAGLATLSISDILFTYADWNGFYIPDGRLNWLTIIVDVGNLTAYVLMAYGMLLNQWLLTRKVETGRLPLQPQAQPIDLQKVMMFIDEADRVVFANYNLSSLFLEGKTNAIGMPLWQALGISQRDAQAILEGLHNPRTRTVERYLTLYRANGDEISGWLQGQANFNDLREYTGADITCLVTLQAGIHSTGEFSGAPVSAQNTLVFNSQEAKLLLDYFSRKIRVLYESLAKMGGETVSSVFDEIFNAAVPKQTCLLHIEKGRIQVEELPVQPEVYAPILREMTAYAASVLPAEMVAGLFQRMDAAARPEMLTAARKFGLTN